MKNNDYSDDDYSDIFANPKNDDSASDIDLFKQQEKKAFNPFQADSASDIDLFKQQENKAFNPFNNDDDNPFKQRNAKQEEIMH